MPRTKEPVCPSCGNQMRFLGFHNVKDMFKVPVFRCPEDCDYWKAQTSDKGGKDDS